MQQFLSLVGIVATSLWLGCFGVPPAGSANDGSGDAGATDNAALDDAGGTTFEDAGVRDATTATNADAVVQDDGSAGSDVRTECVPHCRGGTTCVDGTCTCRDGETCNCPGDVRPPGAATCPAECTGGCDETTHTCVIDCGAGECEGDSNVIECPESWACLLRCTGVDACDTSTIECPADYACKVECLGGADACGDIDLRCGAGSCAIECADDACSGASVSCGGGSCEATCGVDASRPELTNQSAACAASACE